MIPRSPRWLIPAALLLAIALLGGACSRNSDSSPTATVAQGADAPATVTSVATGQPQTASSTPAAETASPVASGTLTGTVATIGDLLAGPDDFTGETVLTHGYIGTIFSANVIVLTDASQNLLVLGAENALPEGLAADEFVEVSGRIEPFDARHAADELDISLDGLDVARFDGEPSLVVEAVRAGAAPIGEILADPASFENRTIAASGQISTVIDARAFVLAPATGGAPDDGMLVATAFAAVPAQMAEQARVQVVGRIVELDAGAVSSLGEAFAFLADPAFDAWRDKPVFVSDVVDVIAPAPTANIEAILSQPDTWEGKTVTVIDTVVARLTDRAVSIGPDGVLMIAGTTDQLPATVAPGVTVVVNGAVQRFDPDNPPDIAGFDPAHPAVAAYAGKPIIVVTSVQVLPGE